VNTDESDVRTLLHQTAEEVTSPPDFLAGVLRVGRRRLARRRLLTGACLTVVAAATTGAALRARSGSGGEPIDAASPLFESPTRGDLAGDESYLDNVLRAWRAHMRDNKMSVRGEPHVVWAGATPAGPAAFVVQRINDSVRGPKRWVAMRAFVRPTARGPQVMRLEGMDEREEPDVGYAEAALMGADRDLLVVLDTGRPVEYSTRLRYAADGKVQRTFRPVVFDDGAAVLPVPAQRTKITVALRRIATPTRGVVIVNFHEVLFPDGRGRPQPPEYQHLLPGAELVWGRDPQTTALTSVTEAGALAAYVDHGGSHAHGGSPLLTLYAATPDGRRLYMTTMQYDDDPSRVIALLARGDAPFAVVASAFVDWAEPLPVRLPLPDGQGTLVAAEGAALSYRSGAGWRDAGRDAALIPAGATVVRVTPSGGTASTVRLAG
jgi:hypothetical protein